MPFSWSSSVSKSKMHFSRILSRFQRKLSATEMIGTPHHSLEDFLAQRTPITHQDSASDIPMCPTCREKMQAHDNGAAYNDSSTGYGSPTLRGTPVSCIFSPVSKMPLSGKRCSVATTSSIMTGLADDIRAADTEMVSPSTLIHVVQQTTPTHPAIIDLPPPFNRHSAPTYSEGPAKQAEMVHQASQMELQQKCSVLDFKASDLEQKLEATEQELIDTTQQLENVLEDLAARETTTQDLRSKCASLENALAHRIQNFNALLHKLEDLATTHAKCSQQARLDQQRIQILSKCRRSRHCTLKAQIIGLSSRLAEFEGLEYKASLLSFEMRSVRAENERLTIENDDVLTHAGYLMTQSESLTADKERLEGELESLRNRSEKEEEEEDVEALKLAEREVYLMHERVRKLEGELKQRRTSLEVVRQNNRDLGVEIACLKYRLANPRNGAEVRWTV